MHNNVYMNDKHKNTKREAVVAQQEQLVLKKECMTLISKYLWIKQISR